MNSLEPNDAHCLRAAEGWLALDRPVEANEELDCLPRPQRTLIEVLILRWAIYSRARMWDVCLVIARFMTARTPNDPRTWIALGETFRGMGRIAEAYSVAASKALEFPACWRLLYDTARFGCLLGKRAEAQQYYQLARAVGDTHTVTARALADIDLTGLWS